MCLLFKEMLTCECIHCHRDEGKQSHAYQNGKHYAHSDIGIRGSNRHYDAHHETDAGKRPPMGRWKCESVFN